MGAPAAARQALQQARKRGFPSAGGPAGRALSRRLRLALADRALVTGRQSEARKAYRKLIDGGWLTKDERAWRLAALAPDTAPLPGVGRAVLRLASPAPGPAARLARAYLRRGGHSPRVLLAALRAALKQPRGRLQRALDARLARHGPPASWRAACEAVGRPGTSPCCRRAAVPPARKAPPPARPAAAGEPSPRTAPPPDRTRRPARAAAGPPRGAQPPTAGAPGDAGSPRAGSKPKVPGAIQSAWEAAARGELDRALALVTKARQTDAPRSDAPRSGAQEANGRARRWQARLLVLGGRRRQAARVLVDLARASPGGVRHLPAVLSDLAVLGLVGPAERLARRQLHRGARDPVLLRPVARALIEAGRPDAAQLAVERWASQTGDPADAFRFAMQSWAHRGTGRHTARWAWRLLQWTGDAHLPTLGAVYESLQRAGRVAGARRVLRWALRSRTHPADRRALVRRVRRAKKRGAPPGPSATGDRAKTGKEGSHAAGPKARARSPARGSARRAARYYLAAARAQRAGKRARCARRLARGMAHDPARLGRTAWLRLAAAFHGRRLSPWIPWAILGCSSVRSCPR